MNGGGQWLRNRNQHIPKKFSNARWIFQQIQNKIGTTKNKNSSAAADDQIRHLPKSPCLLPDEGKEEDFTPLITSTPKKYQTDRIEEDRPIELPSFPTDAPNLPHESLAHCSVPDPPELSFNATVASLRNTFLLEEDFSLQGHDHQSDSRGDMKPVAEDEEWLHCFNERGKSRGDRATKDCRRKSRHKIRHRNAHKENVGIRHVKKLIMYVNNY